MSSISLPSADEIGLWKPVNGGRTIVHVVVVGCGRVGSELAGALEKAGHSVSVVDKRADAFRRLPQGFGGKTIRGFGFDRDHLIEAGIEQAGALAAVTNGDNSNILTARIARENFGIQQVVARIYDPRRAAIYQRLGIHTVATVSWTTDQVLRRLLPDDVHSEWVDPSGKVCLVEHALPDVWVGKKLSDLNGPGCFWITSLIRLGAAGVVTTNHVGQEGDVAHFVVNIEQLDALRKRIESGPEHH